MTHIPKDFNSIKFQKTISISQEDFDFIDKIRGKKSKAGKLKEIIEFYRINKKL
jgi:hypothetical protein